MTAIDEAIAKEKALRVLVCGGRHYADVDTLGRVLRTVREVVGIAVLIHGDATGADTLASEWAAMHGIPIIRCPANWRQYGKAAGPLRNAEMLANGLPDLVVAFPGASGTRDMIRKAADARVGTILVGDDGHVSLRGKAVRLARLLSRLEAS